MPDPRLSRSPVKTVLAAAVMLTFQGLAARPAAALEPAEIAVIYNSSSEQSLALAKYYMKARSIPENNLIAINYLAKRGNSEDEYLRQKEMITEAEYRRNIVPQIQRVLAEKKLDQPVGGIKCLVTTYDVPLKIGPWQTDSATQNDLNAYGAELAKTTEQLEKQVEAYDRVAAPALPPATEAAASIAPATQAAANASSQPATVAASKPAKKNDQWTSVLPKLEKAAQAAEKRVEQLPLEQRGPAMTELLLVHQRTAGIAGVLHDFQVQGEGEAAEAGRRERAQLEAAVKSAEARIPDLVKRLDQPQARQQILAIRTEVHGLFGRAQQLDQFIGMSSETEAAFDNELALVLADQGYSRGRWLINPRNVEIYSKISEMENIPRTLMVCRIDGATVEKAEEMIDRSIEIEKKGLEGKMYLDARGIKTGAYASMDIDMRELAAWMKVHSTMECVLDDKPELLQAKDCPDAALYCGWYSLSHYVDSCQWLPGAVGYHVASGEMQSLHRGNNTQWVVNLLNRGFCGTLGPTSEPYLTAFPNPAHFFPLLLCGEFTQGEVWEVTAPMLSWRVAYVGDPLYNPFKAHPKVKVEDIQQDPILRNAYLMLRPEMKLPTVAPATSPTPLGNTAR